MQLTWWEYLILIAAAFVVVLISDYHTYAQVLL